MYLCTVYNVHFITVYSHIHIKRPIPKKSFLKRIFGNTSQFNNIFNQKSFPSVMFMGAVDYGGFYGECDHGECEYGGYD